MSRLEQGNIFWDNLNRILPKNTNSYFGLIFQYASLIFVYILLSRVGSSLALNESAYFQTSFLVAALRNPALLFFLIITLFFVYGDNLSKWLKVKTNTVDWHSIELRGNRFLIILSAITLTWTFAFYSINLFYNQPHWFERFLLLLLCIALIKHPAFIFPFLALLGIIQAQFLYPSALIYSPTDKLLVIRALYLFASFVLLRKFWRIPAKTYIFILLALVASHYVSPGIKKIALGESPWEWILRNDIGYLMVSSYQNGWLTFIDQTQLLTLTSMVSALAVPLQVVTLVIELSPLFFIINPRMTLWSLIGIISLHMVIFFSSGIFFWKWMILDAGLAYVIYINQKNPEVKNLFTPLNFLLFIPIVLSSNLIFAPPRLGWFDTPINNYYEFDVSASDGKEYRLPRGFFEPYDIAFAQSRFYFLNEGPILVGTYGVETDLLTWRALESASQADTISDVITKYGNIHYNTGKKEEFIDFLSEWISNYNSSIGRLFVPGFLKAPHHIFNSPRGDAFPGGYTIDEIRVRYIVSYFDGSDILILEDSVIATTTP